MRREGGGVSYDGTVIEAAKALRVNLAALTAAAHAIERCPTVP